MYTIKVKILIYVSNHFFLTFLVEAIINVLNETIFGLETQYTNKSLSIFLN